MEASILDYVIDQLADHRGQWPVISRETGIAYHTIAKISSGKIADPGVRKIEQLSRYFRAKTSEDAA